MWRIQEWQTDVKSHRWAKISDNKQKQKIMNERIRYPNTDEYHINLLLNNATHITKVNTCIHSTISILYKLPGTVFWIDTSYRPAVENQKIKCNEPMGYTPISYVIGKRNNGTLRIMMPYKSEVVTFLHN
jgi:hypothetical protein